MATKFKQGELLALRHGMLEAFKEMAEMDEPLRYFTPRDETERLALVQVAQETDAAPPYVSARDVASRCAASMQRVIEERGDSAK